MLVSCGLVAKFREGKGWSRLSAVSGAFDTRDQRFLHPHFTNGTIDKVVHSRHGGVCRTMGGEEEAAARIQAVQRGRLARLSADRRRRSIFRREATARWEREQAVMKTQVLVSSPKKTRHSRRALKVRAFPWRIGLELHAPESIPKQEGRHNSNSIVLLI